MRAGGLRQGPALLACCAACVAWAETGAGLTGWVPLPAASPPVQRAAADGTATAWSSSAAFMLELRRAVGDAARPVVRLRLTPLGSVAQGDAERYDAALTAAWIAGLDTRPVAVLIGPRTASSGEAVGVAFAGRPDTRFFGQRSRGLATANQMVDLGEGVRLFVMNGLMLDRNRHDYPSGLPPDEASDDPAQAEQRALDWLLSNAACQARPRP